MGLLKGGLGRLAGSDELPGSNPPWCTRKGQSMSQLSLFMHSKTPTKVNPAALFLFFRTASWEQVNRVLAHWDGSGIIKVVPWKEGGGNWALKVDLKYLNKPEQLGYFPFSWREDLLGEPDTQEAIGRIRFWGTSARFRSRNK
jgi:hypothetical protein